MATERLDAAHDAWPLRPWILAAICALAGSLFGLLVEVPNMAAYRPAAHGVAAFVAVGSIGFALGVERRRWLWAALFAVFWGALIGLLLWQMASYNRHGPAEDWSLFSILLAALIATPFFQSFRDVAGDKRQWRLWQLPYQRLHDHAWTDAVIGAAGFIFAGICLLLLLMISGMFDLIGIKFIKQMMNHSWFVMGLAGAGFGGAVGLLRERDRLVSVLQRLVMVVLSVLAPVLAIAVALFLLSLLGTGLAPLWRSGFSAAALMLLVAAAAVLLANAVIGNVEEEEVKNRVLRYAAGLCAALVLPLCLIAAVAMGLRIGQYGWTPDRLWAAICVGVALAYGAAGLWSVLRGRGRFAQILWPLQQKLAIGVMLIAAFLALPILDFGAISTKSQMARLESGALKTDEFDWKAMAFDFGSSGRAALQQLAGSKDQGVAEQARKALAWENRWGGVGLTAKEAEVPLKQRLRILPEGAQLPDAAFTFVEKNEFCARAYACAAYILDAGHIILLSQFGEGEGINQTPIRRNEAGAWHQKMPDLPRLDSGKSVSLRDAEVGVEKVERERFVIGGLPQSIIER